MNEPVLRVVMAPDEFGGTMTAARAAAAMADGWRRSRPDDIVELLPQSDGGPGFIEVLRLAVDSRVESVPVVGPLGDRLTAELLVVDDGRGTAYIESAQACGLHLLGRSPDPETARRASTAGVGMMLAAAAGFGVGQIVVGLGGSATTDGGRGAVQVLGGLTRARARLSDVEVVAATDVTNPLLGAAGAAAVFGPQKGADAETVAMLDARLARWATQLEAGGTRVRDVPGAGAAGGLGALLLALGGHRRAGADVVAQATNRAARIAAADLVITGEGRYDAQTAFGKVVASVADDARTAGIPVVVVAGQVLPGTHVAGVRAAYSMTDWAGSVERSLAQPEAVLIDLSAHVAKVEGQMRE